MHTFYINAMTFMTGNKPIHELIKEKAMLLHEKLIRIPGERTKTSQEILVGFTLSQATKALRESGGVAVLYFRSLH